MADFEIRVLNGEETRNFAGDLAALRITVFREFPYLYDGTMAYEHEYLERYLACGDCVFVLVLADGKVVGTSTGLPLTAEVDEFRLPFERAGYHAEDVFYFGESVLLPAWRGRGIGHRFFDEREAFVRRLGPYAITTFCAVERPADHPARPADYHPHDIFWNKRGYTRQPELRTTFDWREIGEQEESPKPMVFWTRHWC